MLYSVNYHFLQYIVVVLLLLFLLTFLRYCCLHFDL